ncbi:MAG TPA: hypothetical protein VML50_09040 [Anaeromyxobacter sp.]|nr:hypothetical protein [Anaeromyxobacter sp.]
MPRLLLAALALALGCAAGSPRGYPPIPRGDDDAAARAVLGRFAGAVQAGRWDEAHALLTARWRDAYTASRLAADYRGAGPVASDAAGRVAALLAAGAPLTRDRDRVTLPAGPGLAAVLLLEEGSWRVDRLE